LLSRGGVGVPARAGCAAAGLADGGWGRSAGARTTGSAITRRRFY